MDLQNINTENFEKKWLKLSRQICQAIYVKPEAQELKASLQKNGFLSLEEKSKFIDICDKVKYEVIETEFGKEGTEGYVAFSAAWREWFQDKGVESQKNRSQRDSVDHIMFGSTPDPEQFLMHFEQEILGSMKE